MGERYADTRYSGPDYAGRSMGFASGGSTYLGPDYAGKTFSGFDYASPRYAEPERPERPTFLPAGLWDQNSALDQAPWALNIASVIPNDTIAPDGTMTADTLKASQSGLFSLAYRPATGPIVFQAFVKAGTAPFAYLYMDTADGFRATWINLASGRVATNMLNGAAVAVGDGWFLVRVSGVGAANAGIGIAGTDNSSGASNAMTVAVWGAQRLS